MYMYLYLGLGLGLGLGFAIVSVSGEAACHMDLNYCCKLSNTFSSIAAFARFKFVYHLLSIGLAASFAVHLLVASGRCLSCFRFAGCAGFARSFVCSCRRRPSESSLTTQELFGGQASMYACFHAWAIR